MWSLIVSTTLRNRSFSPGMLRLPSSSAIASITFGGAVEECDVTAVAEVRSCWFFGPQPEAGGEPFPPRGFAKRLLRLGSHDFSVFSWP